MRAEDEMPKVVISKGAPAPKERWPFSRLKIGQHFQVDDLTKWIALRSAASRAGKRLNKEFSVRKVVHKGREVIRVYAG